MAHKPIPLRAFNSYDVKAASEEVSLLCPEPTMAQQHFQEECDINTIVDRFKIGIPLPENVRAPMWGDFTGLTDFRQALDAVAAAEDSFMQMPAKVRSRFGNDPAEFVDFCSNPLNRDEMRALGLIVEPPATPPPASGVSSPVGAASAPQGASGAVSAPASSPGTVPT